MFLGQRVTLCPFFMVTDMGFSFVRILVHLELTGNIPDSWALFRLSRNGWQNAFRSALGCCRLCCETCPVIDCPGHHAFSQALTPDPSALRKFQKPAPPFVFDIPILPEPPNKNARCSVWLTLVGSAVQYFSTYLDALRFLFDHVRVPFKVVRFEAGGYGAERYPLPSDGGMVVLSDEGVLQSRILSPYEVSMEFVSPLRLLHDGKPVRLLSPSLALRSLMRRVSSLAYYYGGTELGVDFKWLARQSTRVVAKGSTLSWNDGAGGASGLTGCITLVGDLSDFHYFLAMGEYLNLGKGAAYGLGSFILRE